ncbi:MAG: DUF4293 family protein [Bacteroidales bacterium]|jgi:hypothetical protein|nr:DUF4293 family protein [Bacteroidales bacterium]MBR5063639.1 DUF4293 family protein [Bacteroidales bacterium]
MWQRIQTLYLMISMALAIALLAGTAYTVADPDGMVKVTYLQLQRPYFAILLSILSCMIALALIVYKNRILQMRLAVLSAIVALGMQAWLAWMYFTFQGPVFKWTVIFPLIICISNLLAARGCFQDQLMVESAYRVRERRKRNRK